MTQVILLRNKWVGTTYELIPLRVEESTYPLVLASHSLVSSYLENTKQLGGEPLFINIFTGSQS